MPLVGSSRIRTFVFNISLVQLPELLSLVAAGQFSYCLSMDGVLLHIYRIINNSRSFASVDKKFT